jgi:hypothetical protein
MTEKYEFRRLTQIFEGDGADIRLQLVLAGLLLMIFERFKTYVTSQVDGFFSTHMEIKDGDIKYTRGEKFKELIQQSGAGKPGQHANKPFRAALRWFLDLQAISQEEFDHIERLYVLRNEIGHRLLHIVADDGTKPIELEDVLTAFAVYLKIVRWWIKEVEATTDPDMDQETYDNTDWDNAESSDTVFLREIIRKSLFTAKELEEIANAAGLEPRR